MSEDGKTLDKRLVFLFLHEKFILASYRDNFLSDYVDSPEPVSVRSKKVFAVLAPIQHFIWSHFCSLQPLDLLL